MNRKAFLTIPVLLALIVVLTATSVLAQVTPAGTQIRNRSSATYEDMTGNGYSATSNEVITIVLPVYGVSILPDDSGETPPVTPAMSQNALPGMTLYYRYDLTNTGNDDDDFSLVPIIDAANNTMGLALADITIYRDLNSNGIVDLGEPAISAGGAPGNTGILTSGQTISIIVSYTVPVGAATGQLTYVGVTGTSVGDAGQVDTRNYHRTDVVNDAVLTANLAAAPAVAFDGDQITYTLSGTNIGSNDANGVTLGGLGLTGVLFFDVIPVDPGTGNPMPISGVPFGSPAGGTVVYLNAGNSTAGNPETWNWSTTSGPGDIAVGYITNGPIVSGQSFNFVYQVTVPAGMTAGPLPNTEAVAYVDNNVVTPDPTLVVSNNAIVTIGGQATVLIGPSGNPGAGTPPDYDDDVQSIATAYAGTTVDFVNTVRNDGNAPDQINVIFDGASTLPATWGVVFLQSDGVTPLPDTGTDGMPDVGPLAPGATEDIVVRLVIPGDQAAGGPFDAVIRAQSTIDPTEVNLTTNQVTSVVAAGADIGNFLAGPGTDDTPVNLTTDPATTVDFGLDVINPSGGTDTYTLTYSVPAGWGVTFYEDTNANGVLDPGETTSIVAVGPIAAFSELNIIARVDVPAGTAPGANPVSFTATSVNNNAISDTIANTVTVNSFAAVEFVPDQNGSTTPGGTVRYAHTVTNTGNVGDTFTLSYVSSQGWTYVFYDALNNVITDVTLAPGASVAISVQLIVPGTATVGMVETATLSATGNVTLVSDSAIDITAIVAGNLQLTKAVSPPGNQVPGTELTYTTDYQNLGTDSLTTIVIVDPIPAFTQYRVGSADAGTFPAAVTGITPQFSTDGGATWAYSPVSGGGGAPANFDASVTNVRFVFAGHLEPGDASAVGVSFVVRIVAE
ncbi:MAG: hypothetical protein JSW50_15805 [Candidatus Latescibacterota bacterium]|nr:MAG: hypothetical protein JSW50_15805 [Candidatus Latescibacterota bacterium]